MKLSSPSRVGEILRGLAWPADDTQAESLLRALGAIDAEISRGRRIFTKALLERDTAAARREHPDWWRRSGYVEGLVDIAPLDLLDRAGELDELAAWCTSDGGEAYVWWQAPAQAGKTALMAWFALHPPPAVWVVSFFVTARLASQADSEAFTDGLLDQLAAITGEQLPQVTSSGGRDRLRRRLLAAAVAKAAAAGCRLVLLVDGLDEDCGSAPGSGLGSIAALLPKRLEGLKVVVAGRSDPPIPADVDPDHPLRTARIRDLEASPHARHVTELAERELDELLAVDPRRHDGLVLEVLGLVAASGGGLDLNDLHMLTGRPTYQIDQLVRGVFGRTIAGRMEQRVESRVFLFTHETLRVQALERLGPHTLAAFRERLHSWADSYRQQHWPGDTPGYLVRGYFRMLQSTDDLHRMLALATDTDRHQWLRTLTGGDDAALVEISVTQQALHHAGGTHLSNIARLAWLRERIRRRNTHIPWSLVEVRARLGQTARAEALANSVTSADDRAAVFASLADIAAGRGQLDEAERLAASIPAGIRRVGALLAVARQAVATSELPRARRLFDMAAGLVNADPALRQARVFGQLAVAAASLGDQPASARFADQAEACASALKFPGMRQQELDATGIAALEAGDIERAVRLLNVSPTRFGQIQQLHHLAETAAWHGDRERAVAWAEQAAELCLTVDAAQERANRCALIATAFAELGDAQRAVEMIEHAVTAARQLAPVELARMLGWCGDTAITVGDLDRAAALAGEVEQGARSIADPSERSSALALVASLTASFDAEWFGQLLQEIDAPDERDRLLENVLLGPVPASPDRLRELANMIQDPFRRAQALAGVAVRLVGNGVFPDAGRCADEAEQIAQSIDTAEAKTASLVVATNAMLHVGDHARAAALAAHLEPTVALLGPVGAGSMLRTAACEALVAVGNVTAALRLAHTHEHPYGDPSLIPAVALAAARKGLSTRARDIVFSLPASASKTHALAQLAHEHIAAGQPEQARELTVTARTTADEITEPRDRDYALHWLPAVLCRLDDVEGARTIADLIESTEPRVAALVQLAETAAAASKIEIAETVITEAENLTVSLEAGHAQLNPFAKLAAAAAAAGLTERTDQLLQRAAAAARVDPLMHDQLAALLAVAAAKAGRLDMAETLLTEDDATAGPSWSSHASNIAEVLEMMIQQGDIQRATRTLDGIIGSWRGHIQKRFAAAAAMVGNFTVAENVSLSIEDPDLQSAALAATAIAADVDTGRRLLSRALIAGGWDACLTAMAHLTPELARAFADELLNLDEDAPLGHISRAVKPLLAL
ncbi:hypothetical protein GCM10010172_30080 [Paractinoplanes ferrugineus]|uniref:Uncharacterized protein n=1 Tax=Paractinoplanes ferrugineus TaxID=113564 RepID=A0A919J9A6_9ACTN|nr:hypothetical protein [Actinoplanes ferrugineus]GIE15627.1 hypothetical protein Afe05nite_74670 [Actinoplanes ferrugineus]